MNLSIEPHPGHDLKGLFHDALVIGTAVQQIFLCPMLQIPDAGIKPKGKYVGEGKPRSRTQGFDELQSRKAAGEVIDHTARQFL